MKQIKSDQTQNEVQAKRAAQRAEVAAEKRRAAEEIRNGRIQKLETTRLAVEKIDARLRVAKENAVRHVALTNHLEGFYEEIDKLTKGKSLLEVTQLVVQQANDIVRDAKTIIEGDVYLDRTKEFVPAGTNPVYPDVLITLRVVQQSLKRYGAQIEDRENHLKKLRFEANIILGSLQYYLDQNEVPSKEDVQALLRIESFVSSWFLTNEEEDYEYFDFDRLDRENLDKYFSLIDEPGDD